MKIAILHYHLNTGGVTTVIHQQAQALKNHCPILLLTGKPPKKSFDVPVACIPGLAYDDHLPADMTPEKTADAVIQEMIHVFGTVCDVLHVHNPLLLKNRYLLTILKRLQEKGIRLLLQIHDCAEDGRPHVYYKNEEYPCNCHYAVINSRDYHIFQKAGLNPKGLHKLENVVNPLPVSETPVAQSNSVLYPVRAIRRKNIGEAVLLSRYFQNKERLLITLPPNSLVDKQSYQNWKTFVRHHRLNIIFEAGVGKDFASLVAESQYLITTSISEGFGFSFLEPWTAGKFLHGRLLPDICEDFAKNHVLLDHLYRTIYVPIEWVGLDRFYKKWMQCMRLAVMEFGVSDDFMDWDGLFARIVFNKTIDFGILDESSQIMILDKIISNRDNQNKLMDLNPVLTALNTNFDNDKILTNKNAVNLYYHPDTYASKLLHIYSRVIDEPVSHQINKPDLLEQYLKPENLSLLKWTGYAA